MEKPASPKAPRDDFWKCLKLPPATSVTAKWAKGSSVTRKRDDPGGLEPGITPCRKKVS